MGNALAIRSERGYISAVERTRDLAEQCLTVGDAKELSDRARALQVWAQRQRLGLEKVNLAAAAQLWAKRREGELLVVMRDGAGRLPNKTVEALNISRSESHEAQKLAEIDKATFAATIDDLIPAGRISESEIRRRAGRTMRDESRAPVVPPRDALGGQLFHVLYADPPWRYEHPVSDSRRIENQYPTMELDEICALDIPAADNAALFLWATNPKLAEAVRVLDAWKFDYRTNLVWVKDKIGTGYYFRGQHELLLVAVRGDMPAPPVKARRSSVLASPRGKHSEKPREVYKIIEAMYPRHVLCEMFNRGGAYSKRWRVWGNEP